MLPCGCLAGGYSRPPAFSIHLRQQPLRLSALPCHPPAHSTSLERIDPNSDQKSLPTTKSLHTVCVATKPHPTTMARLSAFSSSAPNSNGRLASPRNTNAPTPPTPLHDSRSASPSPQLPAPTTDNDDDDNDDDDFDWDRDPERYQELTRALPSDATLFPSGSRSLAHIALQAFSLGAVLAGSLAVLAWLVALRPGPPHALWRLPAFAACLSVFHYLEFYVTAAHNTRAARADSFLLFTNGVVYEAAHALAAAEAVAGARVPAWGGLWSGPWSVVLGLCLVVGGQAVRSVAMAQAGTNFSHVPARTRRAGHELVTHGVYAWLRHPSYFGFFWWALGTQVLMGNTVCLVGYAVTLWVFFQRRIVGASFPFLLRAKGPPY